jgi:hypothetical protein
MPENSCSWLLFMLLKTPIPSAMVISRIAVCIWPSPPDSPLPGSGGPPFSDEQGLSDQLYIHLSQALTAAFSPSVSITRCRRRLAVSTPFDAHHPGGAGEFEATWQVRLIRKSQFNRGDFRRLADAKSDLQEKQVVLLTDDNPDLEQALEQQLRELTLLPLNIKYQSVSAFQKEGAPKA